MLVHPVHSVCARPGHRRRIRRCHQGVSQCRPECGVLQEELRLRGVSDHEGALADGRQHRVAVALLEELRTLACIAKHLDGIGVFVGDGRAERKQNEQGERASEQSSAHDGTSCVSLIWRAEGVSIKRVWLLAVGVVAFCSAASAQNFPTKTVTVVVPFSAGGPTDTIARIMAERMTKSLGQTVLVENVTGAGGNIGVARVVRAAPDGYM